MIVEFSNEAERDLEEIGDRIAMDNPQRALSFVQELRDICEGLAYNPNRFSLVTRYENRGIRRRVYGNYLIFYRVEDKRVVILHILNGAMDHATLLF